MAEERTIAGDFKSWWTDLFGQKPTKRPPIVKKKEEIFTLPPWQKTMGNAPLTGPTGAPGIAIHSKPIDPLAKPFEPARPNLRPWVAPEVKHRLSASPTGRMATTPERRAEIRQADMINVVDYFGASRDALEASSRLDDRVLGGYISAQSSREAPKEGWITMQGMHAALKQGPIATCACKNAIPCLSSIRVRSSAPLSVSPLRLCY